MSSVISDSNYDSQVPETDRADSSEDSSIGRPEDPVNAEYIKLGTRDKHGHVAMKYYIELSETWWATIKLPNYHLQKLALLLLAITLHSAGFSNMAKLHAYYVTNIHHELNYVKQNLPENDFLKMMHDYTHSLTSVDLSKVDSNMLNIENSINLAYALNNTNQLTILDKIIDHGKTDFDIDALTSQEMQMRNSLVDKESEDFSN
ncbi:10937_t:CDS:2, partial [Gigaspora margarita]